MTTTPDAPPPRYEVVVPDDVSAGIYANGFASWFNQTDFTIDFFVHLPAEPREDPDGNAYMHAPVQVVSRVKLPPSMLFRLMQNLESSMTQYEGMFGPITHLGDDAPLLPPDPLDGGGDNE